MRLRIVIVLSILCCAVCVARADDASKMAKVQEFFKITKMDQLAAQRMEQAVNSASPAMIERMFGVKFTPSQQQGMEAFLSKVRPVLPGALGWDSLEPEYARIYAAAFTEKQLDDLIAFYKSPTGQVFVDKEPILIQQTRMIAQQRLISAMPQIKQMANDLAAQEKAKTQQAKPEQ